MELRPTWKLFGHVGVLAPLDNKPASEIRTTHADLKAGIAKRLGRFDLQAAWTHAAPEADYPANHPQSRNALVLTGSYGF